MRRVLQLVVRWIKQFGDPRKTVQAARSLPRFLRDFYNFRKEAPHGTVRLLDMQPELHDRASWTEIDPHYFYANGWAMRKILAAAPKLHLDIGSQTDFVNLLAAALPVIFLDYRPLKDRLPGLLPLGGDGSRIPMFDGTVSSISSIHVVEHVGLGRYGDPLDQLGTYKVLVEMARVLASGGDMYVATPVGRARVNFNAHRVHNAIEIINWLPQLRLLEFSGVDDDGDFLPSVPVDTFDEASYACGLFHFQRP